MIEEKVGRWDVKREINYSWRKVKETGSCSVRALVTDRTSAQYCSTFLNYLTFAHFCPAFSSSVCQCNACSFFSFLFGFSFSPPYLHLMFSFAIFHKPHAAYILLVPFSYSSFSPFYSHLPILHRINKTLTFFLLLSPPSPFSLTLVPTVR